jgi:DNA-binding transcriptional ArsR family regulator
MKNAPGIVGVAALIGDQARARMLMALMAGQALTATELTAIAGVTKQTISAHLAKLVDARLLAVESQGRHRYFRLADRDIARLLENLMGVAARLTPHKPLSFGPSEPALREARVCYDHLAGTLAVQVFARLEQRCFAPPIQQGIRLSPHGAGFFREFGVDIDALAEQRRPLCRACLDWSERRHHLAGALGAAMLSRFFELGWARRVKQSRVVIFSALGQMELRRQFGLI